MNGLVEGEIFGAEAETADEDTAAIPCLHDLRTLGFCALQDPADQFIVEISQDCWGLGTGTGFYGLDNMEEIHCDTYARDVSVRDNAVDEVAELHHLMSWKGGYVCDAEAIDSPH